MQLHRPLEEIERLDIPTIRDYMVAFREQNNPQKRVHDQSEDEIVANFEGMFGTPKE